MRPVTENSTEYENSTILAVDDEPTNLKVITNYLKLEGFQTLVARSGESAIQKAAYAHPDLILLDVMMPGLDGFETCRRLKANPAIRDIPVIFMTALTETDSKVRGFGVGAVDYITKPFQQEEVLARITTHLRLRSLTRQLQKKNRQLELSSQVAKKVTSQLNLDELLNEIVRSIQAEFGYRFTSIWLVDWLEHAMVFKAGAGQTGVESLNRPPAVDLDEPKSIIAKVYQTKEPYLSSDVSLDPRYLSLSTQSKSVTELGLPLRFSNVVVGVLDIECDSIDQLDHSDKLILQTLADQISIAIRNAKLYKEVTGLNDHLEQKVQERTAQLKVAHRNLELLNNAKSDFIQITSHELRTPMLLIDGYAQLLKSEPDIESDPDLLNLVDNLMVGVKRMEDIVNITLDATIYDNDDLQIIKQDVSLPDIFEKIMQAFTPALTTRNLKLSFPKMPDQIPVLGDQKMLGKLFYHLVVNAIKYTPDGGEITITSRLIEDGDVPSALEVVVSDAGIGIDPQHLDLIFEKFYQTGQANFHSSGKTTFKGGGPGLGLTIARGIVRAHGGKIWAESEGQNEATYPGSKFYVRLPIGEA